MIYLARVLVDTLKPMVYFSKNPDLKVGDKVVVNSLRGSDLGTVISLTEKEESDIDKTAILEIERVANFADLEMFNDYQEKALEVKRVAQGDIDGLKLNMKVISASYTIDGSKLSINYLSEERVDFRDLLKILASRFHCRIELRQIGPRDKAQMVGGIGICGLELCCHKFLNSFEGITINMAKNQMLALNLPKISGQCEKLICCLRYEDKTYDEVKKEFPSTGQRVIYEGNSYIINSFNVMSKQVKLVDPDKNIVFANLDDLTISDNKAPFFKKPQNNINSQNNGNKINGSTNNRNNDVKKNDKDEGVIKFNKYSNANKFNKNNDETN